MPAMLPPEFAELEAFADWALPTERERYAKRLASTMDEMQAFYDAALPRLEDAASYLERLPLDDLPDEASIVLIHDAARPLVGVETIDRVVASVRAGNCTIAALPVVDRR